MELNELAKEIHRTAVDRGWWNDNPTDNPSGRLRQNIMGDYIADRSVGDQFANFHAEVSEAWECWRDGWNMDQVRYTFTRNADAVGTGLHFRFSSKEREQVTEVCSTRWKADDPEAPWFALSMPDDIPMLVSHGYIVKPLGIPIELADVIIRILDTCAAYRIDIDQAMAIKMTFNETRAQRHGGKRA